MVLPKTPVLMVFTLATALIAACAPSGPQGAEPKEETGLFVAALDDGQEPSPCGRIARGHGGGDWGGPWLLFENAGTSSVKNLQLTGGKRDADGRATDAAIVVKHTDLHVKNVHILDNNHLFSGEPDPVVGVMGIAGREGAILVVENGWNTDEWMGKRTGVWMNAKRVQLACTAVPTVKRPSFDGELIGSRPSSAAPAG